VSRPRRSRLASFGYASNLHVFPENPAMRLYARLGFQERARLWVIWRQPLG
jgi:hypothetical protein